MTKQARALATRELIIQAAAQSFERFGYSSTSLSDIVAQASVTRGALYFHFTSKQELASAVIEAQHERSVAAAKVMVEGSEPGLESVIRLSAEFAEQLLTDPVVRAGIRLTLENGTFEAPVPDPYREWIRATSELLTRAAKNNDLRGNLDPEAISWYVVASFTGVQMVSHILSQRADLYARLADMWDVLLPGLVPSRKLPHFRGVVASCCRDGLPGADRPDLSATSD
jgi:TetR/AcrR family transcriptional regulator, repressor for uid operon